MRLDKPIGIWLLVMPCLWGIWGASFESTEFFSVLKCLYYSVLFAFGALIMRSAGCVINDYFDRNIDKQVVRTQKRPLACGAIKPINALILFGFLSVGGLCILLQLPIMAIIIGLFVFIPIVLYPLMKRVTYFPQLFLGLIYNSGIIIGYVTITEIFNVHILWLYASGVLITLAYDTIYAFQDIQDDIKIGVKSSAIAWQHNPKLLIGLCYALALICFGIFHHNNFYINCFLLLIMLYIFKKLYAWDINNHNQSLILFKDNFYLLCLLWSLIMRYYIVA
jgi:4-hydroxybenzoate polyprenyl transferase